MHLAIDASVFELPPTGIAKVTAGLCSACIEYDPTLAITAVHRGRLLHAFPSRITAPQVFPFLPYKVWRTVAFTAAARTASAIYFPWNGGVPSVPARQTVITMIHDVLPLEVPGYFCSTSEEQLYRGRLQRDIDRTHLLFTCSEYSRKQLQANFAVRREPVILRYGPTLAPPPPAPKADLRHRQPYFLYVGGYDKRKGIEQFLRIFIHLHRERRLTSRLILTGSKRYFSDSFRQLVETGRAMNIVEEEGYIDDGTLTEYLQGATALVYPSKYEGFGLPPIEAMTAGCPVLTTRYTSLPEVCGDAVLYADPDDPAAFGNALIQMDQRQDLRDALRAKGYRQAGTFSWEEAATTFLDGVRDTVAKRQQP